LDITAGGKTIAALIERKLVDEYRVTISGHLVGSKNTTLQYRPTQFNTSRIYTHFNNPHVVYEKTASFGNHHIFIRGLLIYRHEAEIPQKPAEEKIQYLDLNLKMAVQNLNFDSQGNLIVPANLLPNPIQEISRSKIDTTNKKRKRNE